MRLAVFVTLLLLSIVGCLGAFAARPKVALAFAEPPLALVGSEETKNTVDTSISHQTAISITGRPADFDSTASGATGTSRKVIIGSRRLQQFLSWFVPQGSVYQPYSGWQAQQASYPVAQPAAPPRYWRNWGWPAAQGVQPATADVQSTDQTSFSSGSTVAEVPVTAPSVQQQRRKRTQPIAQQPTQQQRQREKVSKGQEQHVNTAVHQVAVVQHPTKRSPTAQATAVRQAKRKSRNATPVKQASAAALASASVPSGQPAAPAAPPAAQPTNYCISATRGMQFNVLAAGDSITQGSIPSRNLNHPYTIKLTELLQRRLGKNADAVVAGLGGGGILMNGFSNPIKFGPYYLEYLHQVEWNVAVIAIGINDLLRGGYSAGDIMAGLQPLYDQTLAKGIPVIAIPPFAAPGFVSQTDTKEGQRKKLASMISEAAAARQAATKGRGPQIHVLDLEAGPMDFWRMSNEERFRYLDDGLHMTEFAYDMIGQYVYETVNALFCSVENPTITLPPSYKP